MIIIKVIIKGNIKVVIIKITRKIPINKKNQLKEKKKNHSLNLDFTKDLTQERKMIKRTLKDLHK
jgi:hypothetical protein